MEQQKTRREKVEYIGEYGTRNMICGVINQAVRDWKSAYYVLDGRPTEQECEEVLKKNTGR